MGPVGLGVVVVGGGGGFVDVVVCGGFVDVVGGGFVDVLVDGRVDDEEELLDVEVLEAELPDELPEVGIPKAEIVRSVAETSVGHRANGYVVPETTVPAAARSLR